MPSQCHITTYHVNAGSSDTATEAPDVHCLPRAVGPVWGSQDPRPHPVSLSTAHRQRQINRGNLEKEHGQRMTEEQEHGLRLSGHRSRTSVWEDNMWFSRERSSLEKQCLGTVRYVGWRGRGQGKDWQTREGRS